MSDHDGVQQAACRDYQKKSPAAFEGLDRTVHSVLAQTKTTIIDEMLFAVVGLRGDFYSDFGGQFTPRGGLIFKPTDHSAIKALYARAFRAPVAGELKGAGGTVAGSEDLSPETIDTFELIYSQSSDHWKLSLGGFLSFWKNGIVTTPEITDELRAQGFAFQFVNFGELESQGIEAEVSYDDSQWRAGFSASYVRSYDVTNRGQATENAHPLAMALQLQPKEQEGKLFDAFPGFILNTSLGYTVPDWNLDIDLMGRILIDMTEGPSTVFVNPPPRQLPVYAMLNASISKKIDDLEVQLVLHNILDQRNALPTIFANGTVDGIRSQGFNGSLRLGYSF